MNKLHVVAYITASIYISLGIIVLLMGEPDPMDIKPNNPHEAYIISWTLHVTLSSILFYIAYRTYKITKMEHNRKKIVMVAVYGIPSIPITLFLIIITIMMIST